MKKLLFFFIAAIMLSTQFIVAQEKITTPNKGKTVIYFIRTSGAGSLINFKYFDGEKYLGKFKGRKAFRYECDPGKHIFWVKSENIDYIEAEVKADAIYLIEVTSRFGFVKSTVKLATADGTDKRQMKRINKIFKKKKLIDLNTHEVVHEYDEVYDSKEIVETEERIKRGLKEIAKKKQKGRKVKKITPDMNYIKQ